MPGIVINRSTLSSAREPSGMKRLAACSGAVRWAKRKGATPNAWLFGLLARKPAMLVIVALANKTARIAWAVMTRGEVYRVPMALPA
jgi:hypothetical protein